MLTLFTIPKPFTGAIGALQRNAIGSWLRLPCVTEVILFSDEEGTAACAAELGVRHVPEVERNGWGTPLLSGVFASARRLAHHKLVCYVNGDIILPATFAAAASALRLRDFLGVASRVNVAAGGPLDFADLGWEGRLLDRVAQQGVRGTEWQIDAFLFPATSRLPELPAFAVGRPGWDNWLVHEAWRLRIPVVDMSADTMLIHQNHDYAHVKQRRGSEWDGPEADENRRLTGGRACSYTLADATHVLVRGRVHRALDPRHLRVRFARLRERNPWLERVLSPLRRIVRLPVPRY